MTNPTDWTRSIVITFLGIGVFGSLMVAVVGRIERSLALARQETLRRERAERARAQAEIMALEGKQLEAVGRLAAGVAHDFNNNLTAIIGAAELLKLELTPSDGKRDLVESIAKASNRAAELTKQLNVSTTLLDPSTAPSLNGQPPAPTVLLEVLDTGSGIAKEHIADIFSPFFTTKPAGRGTGLGLASVAGTIRSHGGQVSVESDVGVGTAFRIHLPLSREEAPAVPSPASAVVRGTGNILLVEDDAMVSRTAVATLESFGYEVTHASDGARAVELARSDPSRFVLVLLDLRMPGLTGEQTFDALRSVAPGLRVLVWSGCGAEQDVSSMLRRGAVGFVHKPYRVAELSRTVADAILAEA
jgi:CheY-like chemotaxis protein